jgi:hypothetical protein
MACGRQNAPTGLYRAPATLPPAIMGGYRELKPAPATPLLRRRPDIFAAYERGEYPSVRAAASAGIIKQPNPATAG